MHEEEPKDKKYWLFRQLDDSILEINRDYKEIVEKTPSHAIKEDVLIRSMITEFKEIVDNYRVILKFRLRRTPEINKKNYKKYLNE